MCSATSERRAFPQRRALPHHHFHNGRQLYGDNIAKNDVPEQFKP